MDLAHLACGYVKCHDVVSKPELLQGFLATLAGTTLSFAACVRVLTESTTATSNSGVPVKSVFAYCILEYFVHLIKFRRVRL